MKTVQGVIHGNVIELSEATGFPEGQEVTVTVVPVGPNRLDAEAFEALKRAAGGWSDDPEGLDRYLGWIRQQRKVPREIPE